MLLSGAILTLFKDSLTLIGLLAVMFLQNWKLALISIVMIPLASISAKTLGKRIGKVTTEAQETSGHLTTYLVELFKNHKLIKIFQKENLEVNKADEYLAKLKDKNKKIQTVYVRLSPIMETLTGIMVAVLIFYSGKLMAKGEVDINNFFSFLAAMMLAYQPVRSLSTLNMIINSGLSAASRILPIIDQKNKIKNSESAKPMEIRDASINFNNVNFSYDENEGPTLQSINLKFEGGKMTSLVGHSGSGKSTILNLIPRIYDAKSGDIIIDNQSIYSSTIESLRGEISMVSQETTLFDDTIKNNIKYGRQEATDEEVFKVAKLSYCDEFINNLPNKFDTLIGENGVRLSGGEKQRLSIARAMMKQSSIILLDEATSSLDSETESKIQDALKILTKNKTTVVIAHRLSTILSSNNIYVIDKGKIIDNGNHETLIGKSDLYKNFYEKQIQK
jgi:subfamily B ATP-binding cassette protein MsbA